MVSMGTESSRSSASFSQSTHNQQVGEVVANLVMPSSLTFNNNDQRFINGLEIINSSPHEFAKKIKGEIGETDQRMVAIFDKCLSRKEAHFSSASLTQKVSRALWAWIPFKNARVMNQQKHEVILGYTSELTAQQNEVIEQKQLKLKVLGDQKMLLQNGEMPHTRELMRIVGMADIQTTKGVQENSDRTVIELINHFKDQCHLLKHKIELQQTTLLEMKQEYINSLDQEVLSTTEITEVVDEMELLDQDYKQIILELNEYLTTFDVTEKRLEEQQPPGLVDKVRSLFSMDTKDLADALDQTKQLFSLYYRLISDREKTLPLLAGAVLEMQSYALKPENRCLVLEKAMKNFILGYDQLKGQAGIELLENQVEKTLLLDAFMRGFSNDSLPEEPPHGLPPHIKSLCKMLEIFPRAVALFKGSKEGSGLMPLEQIGFLMDQAGVPGACIPTLMNMGLGIIEQLGAVDTAASIGELFSEQELIEIKSLVNFVNRSYDNQEEFHQAILDMRTLGDTLRLAEGNIGIHAYKRITRRLKLFFNKIKYSQSWKERFFRLAAVVGVPAIILSVVALTAVLAITGIGVPIASVVGVFALGMILTEMFNGFMGIESISNKIDRFLDSYYLETGRRAHRKMYEKELSSLVEQYMNENKQVMDDQLKLLETKVKIQVHAGFYDQQIKSALSEELQDDEEILLEARKDLLAHKQSELEAIVKISAVRSLLAKPLPHGRVDRNTDPVNYYKQKIVGQAEENNFDNFIKQQCLKYTNCDENDPIFTYAYEIRLNNSDSDAYERCLEASRQQFGITDAIFEKWKDIILHVKQNNPSPLVDPALPIDPTLQTS